MNDVDLSGTVAVVTGAGGVLGGGIARAFAAAGAAVGLIWRTGLDRDWPEGVARYERAVPLGRLGQPADIGHACVFLASSTSGWITGQDLVVDGGVSVRPTW